MSDPLRPPTGLTVKEITKRAYRVERLKTRRRKLLTKLRAIEDEIREAGRLLRDVVKDATAPAAGDQLTIDNGDLNEARATDTVASL